MPSAVGNRDIGNAISQPPVTSRQDWATIAVSSPVMTSNRFADLATTDEEHDRRPFTEAKRRRQGTTPPQQQPQQSRTVEQTRHQRGGRLMKGSSVTRVQRIAAAKVFVDKAIFCVDNVHRSASVDDLKDFVTGLHVNVLSCYSTRPRRARGESRPVTDRSAFRLCVAAADRDRLLDSSKWPDSVVISE